MKTKEIVRLEIEYSDGSIERAIGKDAAEIWKRIEGMIVLSSIHGMPYTGPKLQLVEKS